ncbi:MAG: 2-methoxy-6-polyprenyl-1,4-benzoquinol methylase, mitochondrial [Holosporales bacterium]
MSKNINNSPNSSPFSYEKINSQKSVEFEGIPLLVRDYKLIQSYIENAKNSGKEDWYEASHEAIWAGPYRHHLLKRKKYVESILQKRATLFPIQRLLDLGCGDGANFQWLKAHTEDLYGSDYNITRLIRAQKRNIAQEVVLADVMDYGAHDNSFDVVFFNHVLEHIHNDDKALSEVFRILKKGGLCILGVPNEGSFWWQLAYKLQPEALKQTDHVNFYTVKSLSKKIEKVGFKINEIKSLGWGLPHWTLDSMIRGYKIVDDIFEFFGKILLPGQASSLYFIIEK